MPGKKKRRMSPRKKRQRTERAGRPTSRGLVEASGAAAAAADGESRTHVKMNGVRAYDFLNEQALGVAEGDSIRRNGQMTLLISGGEDVSHGELLMQLLASHDVMRQTMHKDMMAALSRLPKAIAEALGKQRSSRIVVKKERGAGRRGAQANGQGGGGESADSEEETLKTTPFKSAVHENQFVRLTRRYLCSPYFNKEDFYLTPEDFLKRLTEKNGGQVFGTHASNSRVYYNVFTCIRPSNSRV